MTFQHAGCRRLQDEVVVAVRLTEPTPTVNEASQLAAEQENYLGFHWWLVAEIETSTQRFYPGQLPALIRRFLMGGQIDEPFEFLLLNEMSRSGSRDECASAEDFSTGTCRPQRALGDGEQHPPVDAVVAGVRSRDKSESRNWRMYGEGPPLAK